MRKLIAILVAIMLALSIVTCIYADEASKSDVILVALLSDGSNVTSDSVSITKSGEYTFTLSDLNLNTASGGLPTVYIKDVIRHTTDQVSGYFKGAKATTVSFKINGREIETPQNKVGETAHFDGFLDMCWIWNGCPLDLGGEVISEISATVTIELGEGADMEIDEAVNVEVSEDANTVCLVSLGEQATDAVSVEITDSGEYTLSLNGLSIDATGGFIPTVFIKDSIKHNTGMDSKYFKGAEVTTKSFSFNGIEFVTPQNPAGSVVTVGDCIDICWVWNGCGLNLPDAGIDTITDISVTFDIKMVGTVDDVSQPEITDPNVTEPTVTTSEDITTEDTTTAETTTTEVTTTTSEVTTEATTTTEETTTESTTTTQEVEATESDTVESETKEQEHNDAEPAVQPEETDEQNESYKSTLVTIGIVLAVVTVVGAIIAIVLINKK